MKSEFNKNVFIPSFLLYFGFIGITFPFLAIYYKEINLSMKEVGFLFSLQGLVMILVQQIWGYLADEVFSPKRVLIFTSLSGGVFFFVVGLTQNFYLLVFFVLLYLTFHTPNIQILNSLLLMYPGGKERYSFIRAFGSLGFIIFNVLMGVVAKNFKLWFMFPIGMTLYILFAFIVRKLPEISSEKIKKTSFLDIQKFFFTHPEVIKLLILIFFYQIAHSSGYLFQSFLIKDYGGTDADMGFCYSLAALLEIPVFLFLDKIISKFGEKFLICMAILSQILRWLGVYFSSSLLHIYLLQSLHPFSFGFFYIGTVIYMNRLAGRKFQSSAQTLHGLVYHGLAMLVGNLAGGQIVGTFGLKPLYLFGTFSTIISFLILFTLKRGDIKNGL